MGPDLATFSIFLWRESEQYRIGLVQGGILGHKYFKIIEELEQLLSLPMLWALRACFDCFGHGQDERILGFEYEYLGYKPANDTIDGLEDIDEPKARAKDLRDPKHMPDGSSGSGGKPDKGDPSGPWQPSPK